MLDRIKALFAREEAAGDEPSHDAHEVAAAVLLVEAANMDGDFDEAERSRIAALLIDRFDLSKEDASELMEVAEAKQDQSVEIFTFTNVIKNHFDENKRIEMIEMLWEVVYSDNELDAHEANLLRRVTGLLHVTDRQSGEARKRVREKLGLTTGP